jgi:hypothetical protein
MTHRNRSTFSRFQHHLAAALLLAVLPVLAVTAQAQQPPKIAGTWQVTEYQTGIRTLNGQVPPLNAEGQTLYEQNLAARRELPPREDMSRCVPSGMPRAMWAPLPVLIVQTDRKITIIQEYHHQLRHIYLHEPAPSLDDIELSYMGESVGRWEGDTLVIETIGLHRNTVLDREGLPHSRDMRITERLRLLDDGKQLENLVTFEDPQLYTQPWTSRLVYDSKPGVQLKEYNCLALYEDL